MSAQTDINRNGEAAVIEKCIGDNDVVFDVGAHRGDWTACVLTMRQPASLHLFEAAPQMLAELEARDFSFDGLLTIESAAIGASEGYGAFHCYMDSPAWSGFYRREDAERQFGKQAPRLVQVRTTSLDTYCANKNIRHVNFIKIDVEGAELDVIQGASELLSRGAVDYVQFEYGGTYQDAGVKLRQVYSYLKRFGYAVYRVTASGIAHIPAFDPALEDFEYSNFLAVHSRLVGLFDGRAPKMPDFQAWLSKYHIQARGVIHVGAHEGQEAAAYAALGIDSGLFFEANPVVFTKLERHLDGYAGYEAFQCAITDKNALVTFHVTSFDQSSSVLPLKEHARIYPDIVEVETVEVPGRRLDDVLAQYGTTCGEYNVLSMDVQGGELLALKGAERTLAHLDAIRLEVNYEELYAGGADVYELDAFLDRHDFVRVETCCPFHPSWGDALYVRKGRVTMRSLGRNGRFANQIFQYAFLKQYAQEHHLRVETPDWIGRELFGANDAVVSGQYNEVRQTTQDAGECSIFNAESVFRDVDFWGYFQYHTRHYAHHKAYFRSHFQPSEGVRVQLDVAMAALRGKGKTLVGLHLRRGDYGYGNFYITPSSWYRVWLDSIWRELDEPVLYIASDDPDAVLDDFSDYCPVTAKDLGVEIPCADFYPDFYTLTQCDYVAISNSSFSFAASMLNERARQFVRPDTHSGGLIEFDPWCSEVMQRDVYAEHLGQEFFSQHAIDVQKASGNYKEPINNVAGGDAEPESAIQISVCISSCNQKDWLAEAIDSVLSQSRLPDEVIVVDDASTDGSCELIRDYAMRYPDLIRPVFLSENVGIARVRNTALEHVQGAYVSFLDGDDRFLPDKLQAEQDAISRVGQVDFLYSCHVFINADGEQTGVWSESSVLPDGEILASVYGRNFPCRSLFRNELVRTELLRRVGGYDVSLGLYEDFELRIRLAACGKAAFLPGLHSEYRQHAAGLSRQSARQHMAALDYIKVKHYPTLLGLEAESRVLALSSFDDWVESVFFTAAEIQAKEMNDDNAGMPVSEEGEGLIFLISQPRAGSTLLQRLLTGDERVLSVAEPWIMLPLLTSLSGGDKAAGYDANLARQGMDDFLAAIPNGEAYYRDALRGLAVSLYRRALNAQGKCYFLDKTPRYHHVLNELLGMFPKAKFVFLLRNPLAVFSSTLSTWFGGDTDSMLNSTHREDLYQAPGRMLQAIKRLGEDAIVVRYEDVVQRPARTVRHLFARLGLRYDDDVLEYAHRASPAGRFGDAVSVDTHTHPVIEHMSAWRGYLLESGHTDTARAYLHALGQDVCEQMGYSYTELCRLLDEPVMVTQEAESGSRTLQADVLTAQGEQYFEDGDVDRAIEKFTAALSIDARFITAMNDLGVAYYHQGQYQAAAERFLQVLDIAPDDPVARDNLTAIESAQLTVDTAVVDGDCAESVAQGDNDVSSCAPIHPLRIVTSIAPRGLENQQRAVASWRTLGFKVVSLNCAEEIASLTAVFPDVEFVQVARDGRQHTGRPLVYFDDVLAYYRSQDDAICGIVNSDIVLKPDEAFCRIIASEAADGLVYGSRVDVASAENLSGGVYRGGFDLFFFPRSFLDIYPRSNFMLGMPWWDYWVPTLALLMGMPVKRLDSYYAFHEIHAVNYSPERYLGFGREFAEHVQHVAPASAHCHFPALGEVDAMEVNMFGANVTRFLARYSLSLTRAKMDAAPYNETGERCFAQADYDGALNSFHQALSVSPDDVRALNNLAVLSWKLGDTSAADMFARKALASSPEDRTTVFNFIDIQSALNNYEEALGACQRYLAVRRDDDEMRQLTGALKEAIESRMDAVREALFDGL